MPRRLAWLFAASDRSNGLVLGISGDGRGDIALLKAMGFQVSTLGNDEHLGPLVVPGGREAMAVGGGLAGSAVITGDGERIGGVVGATTPYLTRLTGIDRIEVTHEDGSGMEELAAIVQQTVDRLAGH